MNDNVAPWEKPNIKIILDIFNGNIVKINNIGGNNR